MAVTNFQADILRLLARHRPERGERYVAGGVALNELLRAPRRSRDIDLFHDSEEALRATWAADRALLEMNGFALSVLRESRAFVEALVGKGGEQTAMQWARDSAFRFFPLMENELLGLTLHPFDLATNKVLAMAGRLEVRDWIDVLHCHAELQPFGYLIWAACGKDPGYNPRSLLAAAGRQHYSQPEIDTLDFAHTRPDAGSLGEQWHGALAEAKEIVRTLPPADVGACVVAESASLYREDPQTLARDLETSAIHFHSGSIGGSWPEIVANGSP